MDRRIGLIFDIQRFSIHDGPGIRTNVYFKGCPLRCKWCDNPESQLVQPEIILDRTLCIMCGRCVEVCPNKANIVSNQDVVIDRSICSGCGKCVDVCFIGARKLAGKYMSVEEILNEIKRDAIFYKNSAGGVTLTGGEVTAQPKFARELLKNCKDAGLSTAIETCGYARWKYMKEVIEFVDLVLYDIKHMNLTTHKQYTNVTNSMILTNAIKVNSMKKMIVRIPVVPGINDSDENIRETARFVRRLQNTCQIELIPYHRLGLQKYKKLGRKYECENVMSIDRTQMERLNTLVKSEGVEAKILY